MGFLFLDMSDDIFKVGEWVVYPSHGVGKLEGTETLEIADEKMEFYIISFEKSNLTLKIPKQKAVFAGMRKISSKNDLAEVFELLQHKIRKKNAMWSKRAQEYETKINSGSPVAIAQVIRELYKEGGENSLSFSEKQVYQQAMGRLAREISVIEDIDELEAVRRLEMLLQAA